MPRLVKEDWKVVAGTLRACRQRAKADAKIYPHSPSAVMLVIWWCTVCKGWLSVYKDAAWCQRELRPSRFPFYAASFALLTGALFVWSQQLQPWIELWNGATWPTAGSPPGPALPASASGTLAATSSDVPPMRTSVTENITFNVVLALRTMLNLSGLIGVVALIFAYRLAKEVKMSKYKIGVLRIMHIRDQWISSEIAHALEKSELPQDIALFRALVKERGKVFDETILPDLVDRESLRRIKEEALEY